MREWEEGKGETNRRVIYKDLSTAPFPCNELIQSTQNTAEENGTKTNDVILIKQVNPFIKGFTIYTDTDCNFPIHVAESMQFWTDPYNLIPKYVYKIDVPLKQGLTQVGWSQKCMIRYEMRILDKHAPTICVPGDTGMNMYTYRRDRYATEDGFAARYLLTEQGTPKVTLLTETTPPRFLTTYMKGIPTLYTLSKMALGDIAIEKTTQLALPKIMHTHHVLLSTVQADLSLVITIKD